MTALAGLWRFDGQPDAAEGCARMLAAQELYGPHDGAQWSEHAIALGRRLMRVLPEDVFDRQPLIGDGRRYVLIADVRLDNRDELTRDLMIPASASTHSVRRGHSACCHRAMGRILSRAFGRRLRFCGVGHRAPAAPFGTRPIGPPAAALSSREQVRRVCQYAKGSARAP